MTKPDPSNENNVTPGAQPWVKRTITLLLLSALIVAGIAVYYTRVAGSGQKRRLANLYPHCLLRGRRMCGDRQLQHGRTLTLA